MKVINIDLISSMIYDLSKQNLFFRLTTLNDNYAELNIDTNLINTDINVEQLRDPALS